MTDELDDLKAALRAAPPVDPATVPTMGTLTSISERIAARRAALSGAKSEVVAHHRRDRKKG